MILIEEKMNSESPNELICVTLIATMTMINTVTQIATLRSGSQYWMIRPAAVRLLARTMAYLRK